jgi:predicted O-methyltransferase YrrM
MRLALRPRTLAVAAGAGIVAGMLVALASVVGLGAPALVVPTALIVSAIATAHMVNASRTRRSNLLTRRSVVRLEGQVRAASTRVRTVERAVHEAGAMATLALTSDPYPLPLGGNWALSWDAAVILARETGLARPEVVVELGSGGSSVLVGRSLRQAGRGHLYSLDHDPAFAALTRQHVEAHGLEAWVTVLDAPLVECVIRGERFRWYDVPAAVQQLERIDLLIVDGPPQATDRTGLPRYPALPSFQDRLTAGAIVFVDDAYRDAERQMLDRWIREEEGWTVRVLKTSRGTALVRRTGAGEAR